ncbi:MAG: HNH endonuclease [Treponemataceae bacterium]|nr:HNH endonuclease [Treponemataceae bacterium]
MEKENRKYTTKEVADRLGVSPETCKKFARENNFEKNYTYLWSEDDIKSFENRESRKNCKPETLEKIKEMLEQKKLYGEIAAECKITTIFLKKIIIEKKIMTEEEYINRGRYNSYETRGERKNNRQSYIINTTDFNISETTTFSPIPKSKKEVFLRDEVKVYNRNSTIAQNALERACYKCEIQETHPSFISKKNSKQYVESHHLIPISCQDLFDNSLDVEANVVSLCSNCHKEIHYGKYAEKLIKNLYEKRQAELNQAGIEISLEQLLSLYE